MKVKLIAAAVAVLGLLIILGYSLSGSDSNLEITQTLGKPGAHSETARLPELAMRIEFDQAAGRIISRQENNAIVAWDLKSGQRTDLATTATLFAYCRDQQLLLLQESDGAYLVDLKDSQRRLVDKEKFHHAAWNADCSAFVLANANEAKFKRWRVAELPDHIVIHTEMPIRNGIAMSTNGKLIATAQGTYADEQGHDTELEIFALTEDSKYTQSTANDDNGNIVLGMWSMAFTPGGDSLVVGSQTNKQSGLRNLATNTAGIRWQKSGFESYWIRAIAVSPDGNRIATGDEKGWLRIWDIANGDKLAELNTGLVIQTVSFSNDGQELAVALWDSTIAIVDLKEL